MKFFKGKIDIGEAFSTVSDGVDKMIFTTEERSDVNKEIAAAQIEFIKSTASENSTRSITRRYLSFAIMGVFLLLLLVAVIARSFDAEYATFVFEMAKELKTLVIMVATFFFGGYYANKFIAEKQTKKKRDEKTK